jgi:hypothetical protein
VRTNIGLSHAKAREYWIYRGPRQLFTTGCFISFVIVVNEMLRKVTMCVCPPLCPVPAVCPADLVSVVCPPEPHGRVGGRLMIRAAAAAAHLDAAGAIAW